MPSIPSFNLGSYASLIRKEEEQKKQNKKEATIEGIQALWKSHLEQEESNSIKAILKRTELALEPKALIVYVPNALSRDMVQQETILIAKIREQFEFDGMNIEIIVEPSKFPDQEQYAPKRVLTNKEKYQSMVLENPAFEQLKEKFGLVPDTE